MESDLIRIEGGQVYTAGAMTMTDSGTSTVSVMFMYYYDENKNELERISGYTSVEGEWAELSFTTTAPEEAAYASVAIFSDSTGIRSLYYDDIFLKDADGEHLPIMNSGFEQMAHKYADIANILVEYVQKSTGITLPVMTEEELHQEEDHFAGDIRIYIGNRDSVGDTHIDEGLENLKDEGFLIHPHGNRVVIASPTELGMKFGVYEFLERYVGVRWLMQGPYGEDVPQLTDIMIPREDVREEPAFAFRELYPATVDFSQRNKLHRGNRPIRFNHMLHSLFPPEKYGETNPEFYPNGDPPAPGVEVRWQPCFTAEGTVDAAVSGIITYFNEQPDEKSFSLSVNDMGGYCETDPTHPEYPGVKNSIGLVDMSDIYYEWVNEVVERVLEVYPDKWFGLLAYQEVMDPPSFPLHPRVVPFLTKDRLAWIDEDVQAESDKRMEGWNEVANQVAWWDYTFGSVYMLPRVYPHQAAKNIRYANEHGVYGVFSEMDFNAGDGPKAWVSAQLLWDPEQDVDTLLQEWYERTVGPEAAPYLAAYYELWEQFWTDRIKDSEWFNKAKWGTYLPIDDASYFNLVRDEDIAESRRLMELVVAKAGTQGEKKRAEILMRAFEYYEASALSYPTNITVEPPLNEQEAMEMLEGIKLSLVMAEKRHDLIKEFEDDPALWLTLGPLTDWDGIQKKSFDALQSYVETEPDNGPVKELVDQFLAGLPYDIRYQFLTIIPDHFSAHAVKTTASKDDILQTLDFSQGPWTESEPFNDFLIMNSNSRIPPVETKVYMLWDEEYLYVGYENFDPNVPDIPIEGFTGNSVQTFFAKSEQETIRGYFTNPAAEPFTYVMEPGSGATPSNATWETNAQINNDSWNAVQVIPFSSIGIDPNQTDEFMGLFFRNYNEQSVFIGWGGGAPWSPSDLKPIQLVTR